MSKYAHTYYLRQVSPSEFMCRRVTRLKSLGPLAFLFDDTTYLTTGVYNIPHFKSAGIFDDGSDITFKAVDMLSAQDVIRKAIMWEAKHRVRKLRKEQFMRASKDIRIPPWVR